VKDYGQEEARPLDVDIAIRLKEENKAFKVEKYEHAYPHCWRTDRPVLYYPLDSWFIRTTAVKDRLIELNETINWKPASTGTGRFGNWLENLVDWNLSRSRYWGIPLPIWATEDMQEIKCVGSVEELRAELERSVAAGFMDAQAAEAFFADLDLHKPGIDEVVLVSSDGQPMRRESDLIDVWFDSGAMPFAQWHYPFENQEDFKAHFPADFIAEGVDQTRGWFFTLHAIAVMLEDSVAFRNVIANGLVQDKDGNKMSKRLGNMVNPIETIETYGADATRWYMIANASPWENLRFNFDGIKEVQRKFFGTLYNTYGFFALYANIDSFTYDKRIPVAERSELDRWIISVLNSLIREVDFHLNDYEPTKAIRAIDNFVTELLSNWYVRLSRRRFWKGEMNRDKEAAFQTLYECLETVSVLMSPFAPFFAERLYQDLTGGVKADSVHLADFPKWAESEIDPALEERMDMAQRITSLIRSIRRKENMKIRQPLSRAMIAVLDPAMRAQLDKVKDLVAHEVNVKEVAYITEDNSILVKKVKPNFRLLGPKVGKLIKEIGPVLAGLSQPEIRDLEQKGSISLELANEVFEITSEEVEILSEDIPGWSVAADGKFTVALDITLTDSLRNEGIARELVNRIQNLRKNKGFDVTDHILIQISENDLWNEAVKDYADYIRRETLTRDLQLVTDVNGGDQLEVFETIGEILITK
jgi:isoleucyl-tRNA synthetase